MALLTPYWTFDGVLVLLAAVFAAYLFMTRHFNHWKKKGILEIPPTPFVGNFGDCCLFRTSTAEFLSSLYKLGKGQPYVGFYIFDKPALVLRDPDIIKQILVKDFNYFANRYATAAESDTLGLMNLFLLKNPVWRHMRHKLTPVFTSAKIKAMLPLIAAVGDDLVHYFESLDLDGDGQVIELKELTAKYTTDIIGSCAFGLRVNSLNNPDAEFRNYGRKIFELSYSRGIELTAIFFIPGIVAPFRFKTFSSHCEKFLRKVFWETVNDRLKSGLRREDLIDILIELRDTQMDADGENPHAIKFDGDTLVAQAAVFFSAGFETSSTLMSFALHELSMQPDIQSKLRDEINTALNENNGKLTYDMIQQLPYLDQVIWETLRMYPSVPFIEREAVHDYTVAKTDLVIQKGTPVYISLLGLHRDPQYFPDPEKYDPERFNAENKHKLRSHIYMPFGEGPRRCIGTRLALLQSKSGIVKFISNYELSPCEQTLNPIRLDPTALFISSDGGLHHRIRRIKTPRIN